MSDASVRAIDGRAVVTVGGAELLSPLVGGATLARDDAIEAAETSAEKAIEASQYASAAASLANRFPTFAAGNAATAAGGDFSVVDSAGRWINIYRKGTSADADHPLIQLPGRAAYAGAGGAGMIGTQRSDAGAVPALLSTLVNSLPRRPEEFNENAGFGVLNDDAPYIQAAINAVEASGRPGVVMLTAGRRYVCRTGLVLNARHVTLIGYAVLDFSSWRGTYIRVIGTTEEFGNSDGYQGSMDGEIIILGQRGTGGGGEVGIGISFDSPNTSTSAALVLRGVTVVRCGVGYQIASRGYNAEFYGCKASQCDLCFDWINDAEDNDERVSVFGGTFFNSFRFLRINRPGGAFYLFSASIDYTTEIADIVGAKVQFFGVHLESSYWTDRPIKVNNNGDSGARGQFKMIGGWIVGQGENDGGMVNFIGVEENCLAELVDVIINNLGISDPDGLGRTAIAGGPGKFYMRNCEPSHEFYNPTDRLHDSSSALADPAFDDPDIQINPIWRTGDRVPITTRDGSTETGPSIKFYRTTTGQATGTGALRVDKFGGLGVISTAIVAAIPVRPNDKARGGLFVRRAPDRPGAAGLFVVRAGFAIVEENGANGIPVIRRFVRQPEATLTPPADGFVKLTLSNPAAQQTAPFWANYYLIEVDLQASADASFIIDERIMDRF